MAPCDEMMHHETVENQYHSMFQRWRINGCSPEAAEGAPGVIYSSTSARSSALTWWRRGEPEIITWLRCQTTSSSTVHSKYCTSTERILMVMWHFRGIWPRSLFLAMGSKFTEGVSGITSVGLKAREVNLWPEGQQFNPLDRQDYMGSVGTVNKQHFPSLINPTVVLLSKAINPPKKTASEELLSGQQIQLWLDWLCNCVNMINPLLMKRLLFILSEGLPSINRD